MLPRYKFRSQPLKRRLVCIYSRWAWLLYQAYTIGLLESHFIGVYESSRSYELQLGYTVNKRDARMADESISKIT